MKGLLVLAIVLTFAFWMGRRSYRRHQSTPRALLVATVAAVMWPVILVILLLPLILGMGRLGWNQL